MTAGVDDARRADRAAYLESLLPAHVRARDAASGGLLRALLEAVAGELAIVEDDLGTLYDSWFVETAPEWLLPYLADLVGVEGLPGDLGSEVSRRRVVANTIGYRQRKGTAAVVEQVVADASGWAAKVVEFHRLLATTAHVNHVRLDRPAWGSVRRASAAELEAPALAQGALTSFAHTGEVRHVEPGPEGGRGRFDIANLGVFVYPVRVDAIVRAPARLVADGWATHPLGLDEPWFAALEREDAIEQLATEADLPVPLRPRRLLAALRAERADGAPAPVRIVVEGDALDASRVRVCGLEDLAEDDTAPIPVPLPGWQVMVDPVRGRVHPFRDGVREDPASVHVSYGSGSLADVGAGAYDRTVVHEAGLADPPFPGDPDRGGDRLATQVHVQSVEPDPGDLPSVVAGLQAIADGWGDPALGLTGATSVLSIGDGEAYPGDLDVKVPAETRLVLVGARWLARERRGGAAGARVPGVYAPVGVRPRIQGDVSITAAAGAAVLIDGVVIDGDVIVRAGEIASLTICQATVAGRVIVEGAAGAGNDGLVLQVRRSVVGGVQAVATVPRLTVADSIVEPAIALVAGAALDVPGARARIEGSTVFGDVGCRVLEATSSICDGAVIAADRQQGCARFSFFGAGSSVPRRYRCVPASDSAPAVGISFATADPGSPLYPMLAPSSPVSVRRGGEFGAEMGVHHHLRRPQRIDAARRLVAPYVPAGTSLGIFGS